MVKTLDHVEKSWFNKMFTKDNLFISEGYVNFAFINY